MRAMVIDNFRGPERLHPAELPDSATPILQAMRPEILDGLVKRVPLRRMGEPEEIYQAVKFIFECDYFTGRCVDVDGGLTL